MLALETRFVTNQEVHEFLRRVRHFHREIVDAVNEVVVEPHRRNRDEQTERGRNQRFGDTGRDRGQTTAAGFGHTSEGRNHAHRRTEQSDERCRGTGRGEYAEAASETRELLQVVQVDHTLYGGNLNRGERMVLR